MPAEFLSDLEVAAYGRFGKSVSRPDLERFFFLDDADQALVARDARGAHNRLGYSLQLTSVRYIGRFLADPLDGVPAEVIDFLAAQLGIADASCVKKYAQREETHREHAGKIQEALKLKDFSQAEVELAGVVNKRAWVTGDGPKAVFAHAVGWLREHDVLLPGVTTLARVVARERNAATQRLWDTLYAALTAQQRAALDALLEVPPGGRVSPLEQWRTAPVRASGPQMVKALHRVAGIIGSGLSRVDIDASVTPRRLAELARWGTGADVAQLKRHGDQRRLATLVATAAHLEATAIDDALELLDLLVWTELVGAAKQEATKETVRQHPRLSRASATLMVVGEALLEARNWGEEDEVCIAQLWEAIEVRLNRSDVRAAVETVKATLPPPEALPGPDWRAQLSKRTATVVGLCRMLTSTVKFGANAQGMPVLEAMRALGEQLGAGARWSTKNARIHAGVVPGPWKHLVFGHPVRPDGTVDRGAYIFAVLTEFCRHLKNREIYAEGSTRYRNPQARLLEGLEWDAVKDDVLTALGLPEHPGEMLASCAAGLDGALTYVAGRLAADSGVRVDEAGKIHLSSDKALEDPPSLIDLRKRIAAMLAPRRHRRPGPGGDEVGAGVPRLPHRPVRREHAGEGPQHHRGGRAHRTSAQRRLRAGLQPGRADAGAPPDRACRADLPARGQLHRRQPRPDRGTGRDRVRPGTRRRAGRRDRRDAVRRPRPLPHGQTQQEILRPRPRNDMAQRNLLGQVASDAAFNLTGEDA